LAQKFRTGSVMTWSALVEVLIASTAVLVMTVKRLWS
jgi:hypothetical protein